MSTTLLENAELTQGTEIEQPDWAMARARMGAAWLDSKFGPDWDRRIDLETLDIGSLDNCILGQLGRQKLPGMPFNGNSVRWGFSRGPLMDVAAFLLPFGPFKRAFQPPTDAWKALLRERWNKRPAQPPPAGGNSSQRRDWNQAA